MRRFSSTSLFSVLLATYFCVRVEFLNLVLLISSLIFYVRRGGFLRRLPVKHKFMPKIHGDVRLLYF